MSLPKIAVTLGDPAGIGPEAVVGAWADPRIHEGSLPLVVGHPRIVERAVQLLQAPIKVVPITSVDEARPAAGVIPCLMCGSDDVLDAPVGRIDARGGQAAYDALMTAAHLALDGRVQGITTGPLHKEALHLAGHSYPGHTELLAELCGVQEFAMMLYLAPGLNIGGPNGLAVVHVTLHMALADVFAALTEEAVLAKIRLVDRFLHSMFATREKLGLNSSSQQHAANGYRPSIGVCALNPHGGENGLFGREEQTIIQPAVARAQAEHIHAIGPLPADTLLSRAARGEFDAVVAMYHDQGHIAIKLLAMHQAVNITLGLPIVRTSVAHGTAFDVAWQGKAESQGMVQAIRVASWMAAGKGAAERGT